MKDRKGSGMGQRARFLLEAETGGFRIQCQPDLEREFQASLGFIEKPLKNKTEKNILNWFLRFIFWHLYFLYFIIFKEASSHTR